MALSLCDVPNSIQNDCVRVVPLSLTLALWSQQSFRLTLLLLLCEIRPRDLAPFHGPPIHNSTQPAHRPQHSGINDIPILIDRILPHPEPHSLDNSQYSRFLARRRPALKFRHRQQFPFDTENSFLYAGRLDLGARGGCEAAQGPFGCGVRSIYTGSVGGFDVVFANDVDGAFFRRLKVAQRVFGVGKAACEADGEEWGVVVYDVGVGEGSEICGGAYVSGCGQRKRRQDRFLEKRNVGLTDRLQIVC